ncbi:hypothetical protein FOCC_FOCC015252 [Frankliniella occidentalis]|nr:hypothetical protein FOCC_FOCC015252 [Frankliniella occidentalis]
MAAPAFNIPLLRSFDPAEISVTGWVQLFDGYCTLVRMPGEVINENGVIPPNARRTLFIQCLANAPFECLPLIRLLRQKYEPHGLVSTNRLQFNRRVQLQTESATDYITALQVLADRCEYGLHYPEALRDQLIGGVRSNELRLILLKANNLTFFQAKELCEKDDALRNEVRLMAEHMKFKPFTYRRETPHGSNGSYKKQNHEQPRSTWNPCFRCSRKHDGWNCPVKDWECHKCHKKGHISKCCPQRLVKVVEPQVPVVPPTAEPPLSHLGQQPPLSSIEEEEPVQVIFLDHVSQSPPVLVRLSVNGSESEMEVDTGAGVTVVSYAVYSKFLKSYFLSPSPFVLNSLSGSIKVFGQLSVSVALPSQPPAQLIIVVCDTVAPVRSLLGGPWLDVLFKDWRIVFLPANVISSVSDRVQQLQHMFPKVFDSLNDDPITPFKANAPAIFQQVMDCILKCIPGVKCYLDDTLVCGSSLSECFERTSLVLRRLSAHNVQVNLPKCQWFVNQVEYLGNIISKECRKPSPDEIQAVLKARVPTTKKQVLSFLGLFSYYLPFLPNFSAISKPLRLLSDPIVWDASAQSSFDECKKLFLTSGVLVHYNPELPIVVLSDASPDGLGAILCHKVGNTERPVAFASCALTPCQQNYAQIDREALGIMFAINKFHKFIWGRQFTLVTDNAPLRHILSPDKSIPVLSAQRLQHWSYILQAYNFKIEQRKAELMSHVDALSRVPPPTEFFDDIALHSNFSEAFEISSIASDLPLNSSVIAEETKRDPDLSKLSLQCKVGWPDWNRFLDPLVKPFFKLRENTPTTTTLRSPNDVLLNFKPNSSLSRVLPKVLKSNVQKFRDGEAVLVKLQKRSPPIKGYVVRSLGPIRYLASFEGVIRGPHTNQMERCLH